MSKNIYQKIERGEVSICQTCIHRLVCRAIDNQPCTECNHYQNAADVAPVRHGRWNDINPAVLKPGVNWVCRCSECGCPQDYKHNYCPNCGARMDKEDNE